MLSRAVLSGESIFGRKRFDGKPLGMAVALGMMVCGAAMKSTAGEPEGEKSAESTTAAAAAGSEAKGGTGVRAATAPRPIGEELERTADGRVRFSFHGQPWLDALRWLAEASKMTLDWRELPSGELNLTTRRSYTLDEARDLFNAHLAVRGFTLLRRGEVLSVAKLEGLNPALVPHVERKELEGRDGHEFVRVSLPLSSLLAEEAAKEFAPLLSSNGKLTPMRGTNQLEAMDMVSNLRELAEMLSREQSAESNERLIVEFKLKHVKAERMVEKLRGLLDVERGSRGPSGERLRMQIEQAKASAELAKNLGKDAAAMVRPDASVRLVANETDDGILVHAPADKLAIIRRAIAALDVPVPDEKSLGLAPRDIKIYRTDSIDPEVIRRLINNLTEGGKLGEGTSVTIDEDSKRLIVYARPPEHATIEGLVKQLDDQRREARILRLERVDPQYALQAIRLLLPNDDGRESGRRTARRGIDGQFRMELDEENRRLMLWASDAELAQVKSFLTKLGEDFSAQEERQSLRVVTVPQRDAGGVLEALRKVWPNVRGNRLKIEKSGGEREGASAIREVVPASAESRGAGQSAGPSVRRASGSAELAIGAASLLAVAQAQGAAAKPAAEPARLEAADRGLPNAKSANPPTEPNDPMGITISESPDGRLILMSKDAAALDAAEDLVRKLAPTQEDFQVFRLKHASPVGVELNLRQIFAAEIKPRAAEPGRLTTKSSPPLEFTSDIDTGTLLVRNATAEQAEKIAELVELYDQPEKIDAETSRETKIYEVRNTSAEAVAEVVKEVYRDLLSVTDKAFAAQRRDGEGGSRLLGYGGSTGTRTPQFKGLLSIGVVEAANSLVISAPAYLMADVTKLVEQVDRSGSKYSIKVLRIGAVGSEPLRQAFSQMEGVSTNTLGGGDRPRGSEGGERGRRGGNRLEGRSGSP